MKRLLTVLVAIAVVLLVISIMMKNQQTAQINYYMGISQDVPVWLIIFGAFSFGVLAGWLTMGLSLLRAKAASAKFRREIKKMDTELASLRGDEETS